MKNQLCVNVTLSYEVTLFYDDQDDELMKEYAFLFEV